jgi:hypothetical protein
MTSAATFFGLNSLTPGLLFVVFGEAKNAQSAFLKKNALKSKISPLSGTACEHPFWALF